MELIDIKNIKVLQFGEGNFLRAFADFFISELNKRGLFDGKVCVLNLRSGGSVEKLKEQKGRFTLLCRGLENNTPIVRSTIVDSISYALNPYSEFASFIKLAELPNLRFVISNSTEAGISFNPSDSLCDRPPSTFPAKLTLLLFKRFEFFEGDPKKALIILPCELVEKNASALKACVLKYASHWNLPLNFSSWINSHCVFYNTLVDRIVSGFPKDCEFAIDGKPDKLAVAAEPYHLWAIEAPQSLSEELPFDKAGLNVIFTSDVSIYRQRKVTLLNAPHTLISPIGLSMGLESVAEAISETRISKYAKKLIFDELALKFPKEEALAFGESVLERFKNPFLKHELKSIATNIIAKCSARVASAMSYYTKNKSVAPKAICLGLAANIAYLMKHRELLNPDESKALCICKNVDDFSKKTLELIFKEQSIPRDKYCICEELILKYANKICDTGMKKTLEEFLNA